MVVLWRHLCSTQLLQSRSAAVSHSIFPALYIISYRTSVSSLVLWTVLGIPMFTTGYTISVFKLKVKCLTRYDTGASGALPPLWPCGTLLTAAAVRRFCSLVSCRLTARCPLPSGLALLCCLCWLFLSTSPPHHFISFCNTRWGRVASTSCRSESSNITLVFLDPSECYR
jgi:hypothetical protein